MRHLGEALNFELGDGHDIAIRRKAGVAIEAVCGGAELEPRQRGRAVPAMEQHNDRRQHQAEARELRLAGRVGGSGFDGS